MKRRAHMGRRARTAFARLGEGHEIQPEEAPERESVCV